MSDVMRGYLTAVALETATSAFDTTLINSCFLLYRFLRRLACGSPTQFA